jgi:maleamate amidohydrolase
MTEFDDLQQRYFNRGFSRRVGFGQRPALLVIDMNRAFTDPSSALGANMDSVVETINRLLAVAREKGNLVVFTTVAYDEEAEHQAARVFMSKVPALKMLKVGTPAVAIDPRLQRRASETLLVKQFASAFFGTSLASLLMAEGCDTLIVTGCTTSGCVRASVVDALQYGLRPVVPVEAVGDRAAEPHHANLFDIQAKYGDVVTVEEVLLYLRELPSTR